MQEDETLNLKESMGLSCADHIGTIILNLKTELKELFSQLLQDLKARHLQMSLGTEMLPQMAKGNYPVENDFQRFTGFM